MKKNRIKVVVKDVDCFNGFGQEGWFLKLNVKAFDIKFGDVKLYGGVKAMYIDGKNNFDRNLCKMNEGQRMCYLETLDRLLKAAISGDIKKGLVYLTPFSEWCHSSWEIEPY